MQNILIIARKELLSTFRQRNLMLIMFAAPIVLVAIMGLAFGGLAGAGAPAFADISVVVVNQDRGFDLHQQLPAGVTTTHLADLQIPFNGASLPLGELLLANPKLDLQATQLLTGNFTLNFGEMLASILLSQPLTATGTPSGAGGSFDLDALTCPLVGDEANGDEVTGGSAFTTSLDDLFDAEVIEDAAAARAGVARGDYAAAVIIPPDFTRALTPDFGLGASDVISTSGQVEIGQVEIVGSDATPISAGIVRAVVEGIAGRFGRIDVALTALGRTAIEEFAAFDPARVDPALLNADQMAGILQQIDASVLEPLGCLFLPGVNNLQVARKPLDASQTHSAFSSLLLAIGSAQAFFFALFTGVFGINSIYEDRRQGTLQRVLVSPTPSGHVLWGRLLGNLLVVASQLLILLTAFTTIASLVEGSLILLWGTNLPALLLVVAGLSLFTTGLGVLIVGLANSSEQVQLVGPLITMLLGAVGGIFGNLVPRAVAQFSPTWWGVDAIQQLPAREGHIGLHLGVLFGVGLLFALVGTFFFRRRMGL